jgi:type VI secretion system protein ImpF
MARPKADQPLLPSVLDRLLDDDPGVRTEPAKSRSQVLRELKMSVRRDLESLLNTRRSCTSWPEHLTELDRSLVNYGLPDITGYDLAASRSRHDFQRLVESVIRRCEPRFKSVSVELLENVGVLDRTLRFRIDALLYAEPAPEPVVFDTALEPATGAVEIKGAGS